MDDSLEVYTLGGLSIRYNGVPVTSFEVRKEAALLVYLAYNRQVHSREVLAELLWEERTQAQALTNLRGVLAGLRRRLGPFLVITRHSVGLDGSKACWLDVAELEASLDRASQQWGQAKPLTPAAAHQLEQALALYQGDFLAGFYVRECQGFEAWLLAARERLRRQVIDGLHHVVESHLAYGAYTAGIKQVARVLQLDPLREEAHRQMMSLLVRMGQRSEALSQYETCKRLLADELGVQPADATTALCQAIQAGTLTSVDFQSRAVDVRPQPSLSSLPQPMTPFIGRASELAHVAERLADPDCRLLTLVGPGGIGKTRVALQAAHDHGASFAHGAHFVSLVLVNSADLLVFAIGSALEFSFYGPEAPAVQLRNYLRDKILLLVLDNFEHLLDGVPLLVDLLANAPRLKLLITSRERLNLQGEWVLSIEGMDYPRTLEQDHFESYAAVQLFVQSARRVQAGFSLSKDRPGVVRICQLVEGMPLGIELAAAWVRMLPVSRIAEQLASSLDFLASSRRDVSERHRSLRAVFEHSWGLLSGAEQTTLVKLSVFRGSFDLEAADEIAGASLPMLTSLADKSLIRADGSGRYVLHELLRQYAENQLAQHPVEADHQERTIDYLMSAAERASSAAAHRQSAALLSQAIAIAEAVGQPALLGELHHKRGQAFLGARMWVEARPDFETALAAGSGDIEQRVQILLELAEVAYWLRDAAGQRRDTSEALALAEAASRDDLAATATASLAAVEGSDGNLEASESLFERALARGVENAHYGLGTTLYWLGRYPDALSHLRLAVELAHGDTANQILPLQNLGLALVGTGQYAEAVRVFDQSQRFSREHEAWPFLAKAIAVSAGFHLDVFDFAGNEALAEEARERARSVDFLQAVVSAGIDLLLNFARCHEVGRAEKLVDEVAEATEQATGVHGWLWRLRLAQACAEIAQARGDWDETLRLAEIALTLGRARGRVKYQALGLKTRAQALAALGRTREAIVDLRGAVELTRPTGDPAMFFQTAAALLALDGSDALAHEAYATVQRISAALPNDEMRRIFEAAEPVQKLARLVR